MSDAIVEAIRCELPEFEYSLTTVSWNIHKNLLLYASGGSNASINRKMHVLEDMLESSILAMRVVMNNYRPINTVPFDVLTHIFGFVARGTDMLPVSGVCRHWREVALATPSLWAALKTSDPPSILPLLVGRAKLAPFSMRLGHTWLQSPPSLPDTASIQSMIPTLRTFGIEYRELLPSRSCSEQIRTLVTAICNGEAHMLEHFILYCPSMVQEATRSNIFGGMLPALRRLTLHGLCAEPSVLSSNLRMLYLGCFTLSVKHLFNLLEVAPRLETLLLHTLTIVDISQDLPSIKLDHLRRLLISQFGRNSSPEIACILNSMDLPDFTVSRFLFESTERSGLRLPLGPPPSPDVQVTCFFPDLKTLEFIRVSPTRNTGSMSWLRLNAQDSGGSSFTLSAPQTPLQSPSDLFNKIPGSFYASPFVLSVRNVTHLLLSGDDEALWASDDIRERGSYTWMPFLEPLVSLTMLTCSLTNRNLESIFSSLSLEDPRGSGMHCCPLLSDIRLACRAPTNNETWHAILTCAKTRVRTGRPLQHAAINYHLKRRIRILSSELREQLQRHVEGQVTVTVEKFDDWVLWSGFPSVRVKATAPPFQDIEDLAVVEELQRKYGMHQAIWD